MAEFQVLVRFAPEYRNHGMSVVDDQLGDRDAGEDDRARLNRLLRRRSLRAPPNFLHDEKGDASAKAAIVGFTNTLARALGPHRIRVNAIAPGTVLTERQRQLWFRTEAQVEAARAAQCLPDLIAPDDIANLALFLASDDSRLITKQTISVNVGVL